MIKKRNKNLKLVITGLLIAVLIFPIIPQEVKADTQTKTFVFASTAEDFTFTSGGKATGAFDSGVGNSLGSLKTDSLGRNNTDTSYWEWSGTWENLGVPAGATVTQIRLDGTDTKTTVWNVVNSATIGPYEIWDNQGTPVLMATLWAGRSPTGVEGSWTSTGAQSDQNVTAGYQASNSTIRLRLYRTIDNANADAAQTTLYDDNVAFVITYTAAATILTQNDWRFYVDNDVLTPTDPWGNPDLGENEALTAVPPGNDPIDPSDEIRIRMSIAVSGSQLDASTEGFILQFAKANDCTTVSSWTDVGTGDWGFATSSVADGTTLTTLNLTVSDVAGRYSKSDPTSTNPNAVPVGQDVEWDWHLVYNGSAAASTYCFRMRKDTPADLDAYNSDSYPKIDTRPGTADLLRHGQFFSSGLEEGFFW